MAASTPPRIVIAGGSGFLGRSLAEHLRSLGARVTVLSRAAQGAPSRSDAHGVTEQRTEQGAEHVAWDGRTMGAWASSLEGATALINLAGRSVACRKTPEHRDEILRSRVESTLVLGGAYRECDRPPPVWVQMSTAHIYGDPPEVICDEETLPGAGFAPEVAQAWEAAFAEAAPPYARRVVLRTSFVLGKDRGAGAGALGTLARLARLGLGGRAGHGRQGVSWIHEADLNRVFERAAFDETMRGTYVVSSPGPESNAAFMKAVRKAVGAPLGLPSSDLLVRIGAALLESDPELALYGRYCRPTKLLREGFTFQYSELSRALADIFGHAPGKGLRQSVPGNRPHREQPAVGRVSV